MHTYLTTTSSFVVRIEGHPKVQKQKRDKALTFCSMPMLYTRPLYVCGIVKSCLVVISVLHLSTNNNYSTSEFEQTSSKTTNNYGFSFELSFFYSWLCVSSILSKIGLRPPIILSHIISKSPVTFGDYAAVMKTIFFLNKYDNHKIYVITLKNM